MLVETRPIKCQKYIIPKQNSGRSKTNKVLNQNHTKSMGIYRQYQIISFIKFFYFIFKLLFVLFN